MPPISALIGSILVIILTSAIAHAIRKLVDLSGVKPAIADLCYEVIATAESCAIFFELNIGR